MGTTASSHYLGERKHFGRNDIRYCSRKNSEFEKHSPRFGSLLGQSTLQSWEFHTTFQALVSFIIKWKNVNNTHSSSVYGVIVKSNCPIDVSRPGWVAGLGWSEEVGRPFSFIFTNGLKFRVLKILYTHICAYTNEIQLFGIDCICVCVLKVVVC